MNEMSIDFLDVFVSISKNVDDIIFWFSNYDRDMFNISIQQHSLKCTDHSRHKKNERRGREAATHISTNDSERAFFFH